MGHNIWKGDNDPLWGKSTNQSEENGWYKDTGHPLKKSPLNILTPRISKTKPSGFGRGRDEDTYFPPPHKWR